MLKILKYTSYIRNIPYASEIKIVRKTETTQTFNIDKYRSNNKRIYARAQFGSIASLLEATQVIYFGMRSKN